MASLQLARVPASRQGLALDRRIRLWSSAYKRSSVLASQLDVKTAEDCYLGITVLM